MISEFFVGLALTIADWFVGLFPGWDVPPEITNFDDTLNGFIAGGDGLGVWIPWALLIACVGIAEAVWLIGLIVKAARWLVGLIPTMGGGT